jgi:CheY-like chemotaxis protein
LHIEDKASNFLLLEQLLEPHPNLKVISAMRGGTGLDLALQHHPDLILLDLHLPDMHGSRVLERLQDNPATRDIPVVIISADATASQIERMMGQGARDYLTKPIDVQRLFRLLGMLLNSNRQDTTASSTAALSAMKEGEPS